MRFSFHFDLYIYIDNDLYYQDQFITFFNFFLNGCDFKLIDVKKKEDTLVDNEYQKQYYSLEHQCK